MPKTPGIKRLERNYYFVQVSRVDPRLRKRRFKRRWVRGTYAEAEAAREDALAALEAEIAGHLGATPTLTDYVRQWLKARTRRLKPSTRAKYLNDLERHILPKLGHIEIAELRPRDIELMLAKDRGAPASKKNRLSLLRAVAKDALADGVTERDFCARLKIAVPSAYTEEEPNLLTGKQLARLLAEIPAHWLDLACTLGYTGLRWGEVSALHWADIDLEENLAHIRWSNWRGTLQKPKTERANRTVPLVDPLPQLLTARRRRMLAEQHPGLRQGFVFPTTKGTLHKGTPLGPILRRACQRAAIPIRFTPHGMRRTWNNIARQLADGMVVRSMIGHADKAMTEHYSRVGIDEKRVAAEAVARVVGAPLRLA